MIGKLIFFLIPILGIFYPLVRFLPRLYDWLMRSRVARIYHPPPKMTHGVMTP
jgi:hypothetical protein